MVGEIPTAGASVGALATGSIRAIAFRSGVLTRRACVHRCKVYSASNDFTNSSSSAIALLQKVVLWERVGGRWIYPEFLIH